MSETVKLLVINADEGGKEAQVSLQSLRDVILNNPSLLLDALKLALQRPGTGEAPSFGELPSDTPVFKMLSATQAKMLTPNARKLTKGELIELATQQKTIEQLNLTIEDLKSVQDAFHFEFTAQAASGLTFHITKCCCSPCCCCAAANTIQPIRRVA
jgi:hypothetical protein